MSVGTTMLSRFGLKMSFNQRCAAVVGLLIAFRAILFSSSQRSTVRTLASHLPLIPVIYTFEEENEEGKEILALWKRKWEAAGWDPVVLNNEHAKSHPSYAHVSELLPDQRGSSPLHWLAVAQAGGGWFSNSEVFPLNDFTNDTFPSGGALTLWENVIPSLVSGSASEFERGAVMLAESMKSNGTHSDVLTLIELSRNNPFDSPFLKERRVVRAPFPLDAELTSCFSGKRAIHFTSYKVNDIPAIEHWLDVWVNSNCSDLVQFKGKNHLTVPIEEEVVERKRHKSRLQEIPLRTMGYSTNSRVASTLTRHVLESTQNDQTGENAEKAKLLAIEDSRSLRINLPSQLKLQKFEWNELVRASTIDENIVHQLAVNPKGIRKSIAKQRNAVVTPEKRDEVNPILSE